MTSFMNNPHKNYQNLQKLKFCIYKNQVSIDKAQELSRQLKIPYLECSAKGKLLKK